MAFKHGSLARVYVNGYDLSAYLKNFSSPVNADTHEVTTFGVTAKAYIPGLIDATLSTEGIYDGAVDAVDQVLAAALGQSSSIWCWYPQGDANGNYGYGFAAIETSYEIETPVDDVAAISAEAQSHVGRERLLVLHALGQETASGNGSGVDNGAATDNGAAAYLQVTSVAGSVTVKVQHSADNGSSDPWADLITFAAASTRGAQRVTATGTVKRYVRVIWTIATGPATFHVGFCRK